MATLEKESNNRFDFNSNLWTLTGATDPNANYEKTNVVSDTTFAKNQKGHERNVHSGIGVFVTALFLLGEMAGGGGVVAMPSAVNQATWYGIIIIILGAVVSGYTGFQLGWCWTILQENWPQYNEQTRKPYPEIGFRVGGGSTLGYILKYFTQFCVDFTVFGASVAFLVLSAQNIQMLISEWFGWEMNFCWLLFIVTAFLWPITLFGTPKDFWPIAVGAIIATSVAVILIITGTGLDIKECYPVSVYQETTFVTFIQAYGTITFAYGGHSAFPTIQHDMKKPALFPCSVLYAYILIFVLYFPMPVFTYIVYGSDNVLNPIYYSISTGWIREVVNALITASALFVYFILINPISQDLEEIVGIPKHFTWKRIFTRTFMVLLILFVALTVPNFGILLNLIGGTTVAAMTFVCPGPYYLALRYATHDGSRHIANEKIPWYSHRSVNGSKIAWWEWLSNGIIVLIGILGGAATIYATISSLDSIGPPCYVTTDTSSAMDLMIPGIPNEVTYCGNS